MMAKNEVAEEEPFDSVEFVDDEATKSNNNDNDNHHHHDVEQAEENGPFGSTDGDDGEHKQTLIPVVPWLRQLSFALRKNYLIIIRRPVLLLTMLLSSICSVLLVWPGVRDGGRDFGTVPLDECGTVNYEFYMSAISSSNEEDEYLVERSVPISYNDKWRSGFAVAVMGLGPAILAVCVFLFVQQEVETKMLGVLRTLGMRESVYWTSWWIPFVVIAAINALLGATTAKMLGDHVHAFGSISFGSIFVSFFFLSVGLIGGSFVLVTVNGNSKAIGFVFILIIVGVAFVPFVLMLVRSSLVMSVSSVNEEYDTPTGMFWVNSNTSFANQRTSCEFDNTTSTTTCSSNLTSCEMPLMSEDEGYLFKTPDERLDVTSDEYFMGCYFGAGWGSAVTVEYSVVVKFLLASIPYTQFFNQWANFLGYTAMPNRKYGLKHFSMSAESLAKQSIGPLSPDNALGTSLYSQGSTLTHRGVPTVYDPVAGINLTNCPAPSLSDSFCEQLEFSSCQVSQETESLSNSGMAAILVAFAAFYTLLAAYLSQVCPGEGNGAAQPVNFPFTWRYWFGGANPTRNDVPKGGAGVSTVAISKDYGENKAVDRVNISMAVGEVTALLGHNGAGKTTLSHMLCCETVPSAGLASIFGLSVTEDTYVVRQLVGVCKQDDYLYLKLSAREHLELFAGLRGVSDADLAGTVQEFLEAMDLALVQDRPSGGFSGGMKRRLSVALSTIGDRPFIVLDEPTTGMDPLSRRLVWKHVDRIKNGRVVLLTTHAMEEADLLSDTVMIMRKGVIAACGSPLELKAEHGSSIQFSILVDTPDATKQIALVKESFAGFEEWVDIVETGAGNFTVAISKVCDEGGTDGVSVEALANFASLLENNTSDIAEYGFSNSSLEEVFLKVTNEDTNELKGADSPAADEPENGDNATQENEDEDNALAMAIDNEAASGIGSFEPKLTLRAQAKAIVKFLFIRDWYSRSSISNWFLSVSFLIISVVISVSAAGDADEPSGIFFLLVFALSIMLVLLTRPMFNERSTGLFYAMKAQGMLRRSFTLGHVIYTLLVAFAFSLVLLSLSYATPLFRLSKIQEGWKFGDPQFIASEDLNTLSWWEDEYNGESVVLYARRASGGYGFMVGIVLAFTLTMPGMVLASSHLPGNKLAVSVLAIVVLFASILPILFKAITKWGGSDLSDCGRDICKSSFDSSASAIDGKEFLNCAGLDTNEGQERVLCMPPVAGLLPQFGVFQALFMTTMSDIHFTSDPPEYVEDVLIPKLTGDYCDGSTCKFPYARVQYGGFISFMVLGAVILIAMGLLLVSAFTYPGKRVLEWKLAFKNGIRNINNLFCCLWDEGPSTGESDDTGKDSSPAQEVIEETNHVMGIVAPFVNNNGDAEEPSQQAVVVVPNYEAIPREEIPPVVAYKLRKEYPLPGGFATKVALESLDLHVPRGGVLGLLGKNGAGKTTALKIFAGAHDATAGLGLVAGYDIACEQIQVFEQLGNCEQFDTLWPLLSVQTHLELFGGLKGLPPDRLKKIAHAVACSVGLGSPEVYRRRAGALSGGMRRRLSLAISLVGAPSVLLLDEPTTGIDPSTRASIWDLIKSFATDQRAIMITTHMMLEADSLCNRIAIMGNGALQTIGTQQFLKDTYGAGYLLQLNLTSSDKDNQARAMDFVRERLHPEAFLISRQAKTLHVALPRNTRLADIFRALYSEDRFEAGSINQFLFSQSSLEDVFISLGD